MKNRADVFIILPLIISILYIGGTFLLSLVTPVIYTHHGYDSLPVMLLVLATCACLICGYIAGIKRNRAKAYVLTANTETWLEDRSVFLWWICILSMISLICEAAYLIYTHHFATSIAGIKTMYVTEVSADSSVVYIVRFICAPFRMGALCLGGYRFHTVKLAMKTCIALNMALYVAVFTLGYGVQSGIVDAVMYIIFALFTVCVKRKENMKKMLMISFVLCMVLFLLLSYVQYLRALPCTIFEYACSDFRYDTDSVFFKIFGYEMGFGMATILTAYLSQGYYGVSLCMKMPLKWTYGVGSSYALTLMLQKLGFSGILDRSYIGRLKEAYGRRGLGAWNTIFPWLASDFTWVGAALFFVLVGYIMAACWVDVIKRDDDISYVVFCLCMVMIIYIPANNHLFHGIDSFITTWGYLLVWVFLRYRHKHAN